jgi:hypothetical protein
LAVSRGPEGFDLVIEMPPQLLVQIAIERGAAEERPHPHREDVEPAVERHVLTCSGPALRLVEAHDAADRG